MKFKGKEPSEFLGKLEEALEPHCKCYPRTPACDDVLTHGYAAQLVKEASVRTFETGATRDTEDGKIDPEGFLSPHVVERFSRYMAKNRFLKDGSVRASDNWQKGIPRDAYMKSLWRHFLTLWMEHRNEKLPHHDREDMEETLCALWFNVQGYLFELLNGR